MRSRVSHLAAPLAAAALVLGVAGGALAAAPSGSIDQKHECAAGVCNGNGTGTYPITAEFLGGSDPQAVSLGQTFTAGATGSLTGVELYLSGFDTAIPASFTVRIESTTAGKPSGTVLASAVLPLPGDLQVGTLAWIPVSFASPVAVTKNTVYAITLAPIASVATDAAWLHWGLDSSDVGPYTDYAGGGALAYAEGGGGWNSGGSAFYDGGSVTTDFAFRTYLAAAAATPTLTQPPTSTISPEPATSGGGLSAIFVLLAGVGLAAFVVVARPARRRR